MGFLTKVSCGGLLPAAMFFDEIDKPLYGIGKGNILFDALFAYIEVDHSWL
jgi:hypothetical protein